MYKSLVCLHYSNVESLKRYIDIVRDNSKACHRPTVKKNNAKHLKRHTISQILSVKTKKYYNM